MYILDPKSLFARKANKLSKKDSSLRIKINQVLEKIADDPFQNTLKTHKVIAKVDSQLAFSSYVSSDIRMIWRFNNKKIEIIELIDIGGHSGGNKVYK